MQGQYVYGNKEWQSMKGYLNAFKIAETEKTAII
jgi:hypothetical protein